MSFSAALPAVFLGDLPLGDFAIPEWIRRGVQQQFTTHKLPGGARVFDNMGPDPSPIEFSGIFLGLTAELQANQLGQMRKAAKPIPLVWGIYTFQVLIERTTLKVGFHRIEYDVSLLVVPDPPPDSQDDDDTDLGTGEPADTPQAEQTQGQSRVTQARTTAGALPVPPIPPAGSSVGQG